MEKKIYFKNPENFELAGILHVPKHKRKIGVIICHEFTGNKDRNFIPKLARELEKNNFLVLRFDFSGNGESEGNLEDRTYSKYVEDLKSAINWFKKQTEKICVIGYSMGGSIALIEYSKYKNFDKLVLLAPGIEIVKKQFTRADSKKLEEQGYIEFIDSRGEKRRLTKRYFEDRKKYDQLNLGKTIEIPTLIIIGGEDKIVSIEKCKELLQIIPVTRKELKILKTEDHSFHNKSNRILKPILEFL